MSYGWGRSATWPTLALTVEAARRSRPNELVYIARTGYGAKHPGFRFGYKTDRDIVARVYPDGTVKGGKQ